MKLKEIKPGMAIHCKNDEEKKLLLEGAERLGYLWLSGEKPTEYFCNHNTMYFHDKDVEADYKYITWSDEKNRLTEFSDLIIPEMTAEEVFSIMSEIHKEAYKKYNGCVGCPICEAAQHCEPDCFAENADEIIEICQQWKSDHSKREPEIETVDICRIIEIQPDGSKRCVHEEDMEMGPDFPTGEEWIEVEKILKRYCMEHDGEFIAVHETVSRVKQVSGKLETHGNARNRTCALLD